MYKLLRKIFFQFEAEDAHHLAMGLLRAFTGFGLGKRFIESLYAGKKCHDPVELFGLKFRNRIGLGAGFDKNAKYLEALSHLGFGSVEIGTVTPLPQTGNDKPRLFRLVKDKALINRMGFNNAGMHAIAGSLEYFRKKKTDLIIGGNIGKNKVTPNEDAWRDYCSCFNHLHTLVDYFVVNVSSPNTPGLRELQEKDALSKILNSLQEINRRLPKPKPLFLKIAPDLTFEQIDELIELSLEVQLTGLVVSNTTISRDGLSLSSSDISLIGPGGLSGLPLKERSTKLLKYIHDRSQGKLFLIGSGGIFTAADAKEKLDAGASLIQVWTGFIYEGPGIVRKICKGLSK